MTGSADHSELADVVYREASASDIDLIAALHAESWRRFYRGAYSDLFLDRDLVADRRDVWSSRLSQPSLTTRTIVAATPSGSLIGFAHVVLDDDPTWGSLIDNLHVTQSLQRRGVGSALITAAAHAVQTSAATPSLYLWVLEQNVNAQTFYQLHGATCAERTAVQPPRGVPAHLSGAPMKFRYVWADAADVLRR